KESFNKRAFCVKDKHLYIINQFYVYNIDISNPNDPVLVARTLLSDLKNAYNIVWLDGETRQFPTNLTGVYIYGDKLIITTRMALNSMSELLQPGTEECGSITMLKLSDLSVVDQQIFKDRCQVSPGGIYEDVLVAGLVHGGVGAWKITDTGFQELLIQPKPEGMGAEYEYQGAAVDAEKGEIYLSQYKYGVKGYTINYDGTTLSLTEKEQLKFYDVQDDDKKVFVGDGGQWTHASMGLAINDTHVFALIAPIRALLDEEGDGPLLSEEDNYSGVLVADKDNLQNYKLYKLPKSAVPAMNVDNGTDQQPMFANFSDTNPDELFVAIGDKGVCRYQWTEDDQLVYLDRWGEEEKQPNGDALLEAEFVQVFDGKVYAIYRYVDDSKNLLLKSWDILR
ncbi:MAG: hypothetical protein U0L92_00730, partial [Clostridia bacterium]|nr:hypothetical protein [Clostridia bacterium]